MPESGDGTGWQDPGREDELPHVWGPLRNDILHIKTVQQSVLADPAQAGAKGGCIASDAEAREVQGQS